MHWISSLTTASNVFSLEHCAFIIPGVLSELGIGVTFFAQSEYQNNSTKPDILIIAMDAMFGAGGDSSGYTNLFNFKEKVNNSCLNEILSNWQTYIGVIVTLISVGLAHFE